MATPTISNTVTRPHILVRFGHDPKLGWTPYERHVENRVVTIRPVTGRQGPPIVRFNNTWIYQEDIHGDADDRGRLHRDGVYVCETVHGFIARCEAATGLQIWEIAKGKETDKHRGIIVVNSKHGTLIFKGYMFTRPNGRKVWNKAVLIHKSTEIPKPHAMASGVMPI